MTEYIDHIEIAYLMPESTVKIKAIWRGYLDIKGRFDEPDRRFNLAITVKLVPEKIRYKHEIGMQGPGHSGESPLIRFKQAPVILPACIRQKGAGHALLHIRTAQV